MYFTHRQLLFASLVAVASVAMADSWRTIIRGSGYQILTRRQDSNHPLKVASGWAARLQHGELLLRWTCGPFQHTGNSQVLSDASITVGVRGSSGPIESAISRSQDLTQIDAGDHEASIDMHLRGTGTVEVDMEVELRNTEAAAGTYCSTVVLTVTAP